MSKGVPAMWMRGGTSKGLYFLKEDIIDVLLSDYPIEKKKFFLNEILDEYLFLINDIRKDELEDIIVNQFESI